MSDLPVGPEQINLRQELGRIDRDRAETQKLLAEAQKMVAEAQKLFAEAKKFGRASWFLIAGVVIAAIVNRFPEILRVFGLGQ